MREKCDSPLVSVVVPVFNGEKYLAETLNSIFAQSYKNLEVIVVDDGSTDSTASIAQSFSGVNYVHQSRAGVGAALNTGFRKATGSFFSGLDADDLWTSEKIELQLLALSAQPNVDIVFGHVEQFISPELDDAARATVHCPEGAQPGPSICTILTRRESFLKVGWFSVELQLGQFIDWYLRATEMNLQIEMLPQTVMYRRLHNSNLGLVNQQSNSQYLRILKQSLDRRRAALSGGTENAGT